MKMPEERPIIDPSLLQKWRLKIESANRNNIFCHCRTCGHEWVDSFEGVFCISCGSEDVEQIACWQFPDD